MLLKSAELIYYARLAEAGLLCKVGGLTEERPGLFPSGSCSKWGEENFSLESRTLLAVDSVWACAVVVSPVVRPWLTHFICISDEKKRAWGAGCWAMDALFPNLAVSRCSSPALLQLSETHQVGRFCSENGRYRKGQLLSAQLTHLIAWLDLCLWSSHLCKALWSEDTELVPLWSSLLLAWRRRPRFWKYPREELPLWPQGKKEVSRKLWVEPLLCSALSPSLSLSPFIAQPFGCLSLCTSQSFLRSCKGWPGHYLEALWEPFFFLGGASKTQGRHVAQLPRWARVQRPPGLPHVLYGLVCEGFFYFRCLGLRISNSSCSHWLIECMAFEVLEASPPLSLLKCAVE